MSPTEWMEVMLSDNFKWWPSMEQGYCDKFKYFSYW